MLRMTRCPCSKILRSNSRPNCPQQTLSWWSTTSSSLSLSRICTSPPRTLHTPRRPPPPRTPRRKCSQPAPCCPPPSSCAPGTSCSCLLRPQACTSPPRTACMSRSPRLSCTSRPRTLHTPRRPPPPRTPRRKCSQPAPCCPPPSSCAPGTSCSCLHLPQACTSRPRTLCSWPAPHAVQLAQTKCYFRPQQPAARRPSPPHRPRAESCRRTPARCCSSYPST